MRTSDKSEDWISRIICYRKDGNIRGALFTTRSNEDKRTNISRPVQKLIPLEIISDSSNI